MRDAAAFGGLEPAGRGVAGPVFAGLAWLIHMPCAVVEPGPVGVLQGVPESGDGVGLSGQGRACSERQRPPSQRDGWFGVGG